MPAPYTIVRGGSLYDALVALRPNGSKLGGFSELPAAVEAIRQDGGKGRGEYFAYGRVWALDIATGELSEPRDVATWRGVWLRELFPAA